MNIRLNRPFALNETGGGKRNEDSIFPEKGKATAEDCCFLVCDGIGGHRSGDLASRTVCRAFAAFLKETDFRRFNETLFEQALDYAVEQLDSADSEPGGRSMGTTLTFLCFHARGVFMAHIGDSRIYHLRKQGGRVGILYKSHDHSLVNDLIRAEIITPEEALTHPKKNVITRALMSRQGKRPPADIHNTDDVSEGDYFFLCTDGVLEQVSDSLLCDIVARETDDRAKIDAIYEACQGHSHDNFSAWLIPVAEVIAEPEIAPVSNETLPPAMSVVVGVMQTAPPTVWQRKRKHNRMYILLCGLLVAGVCTCFLWINGADKPVADKPVKPQQYQRPKQPDAANDPPDAINSQQYQRPKPPDAINSQKKELQDAKKELRDTKRELQNVKKELQNVKKEPQDTKPKPQGAVMKPQGAVMEPQDTKPKPQGAVMEPQGAVIEPQGAVIEPQGAVIEPQGAVTEPQVQQAETDWKQQPTAANATPPNVASPGKYSTKGDFKEGLAKVELNGKHGFIDKTGREVVPLKYDKAGNFSEGLAWVELNGKRGFIDKTGREVIPFRYDGTMGFREGFVVVKLDGKYGFINKTGKAVIPLKYDHAESFDTGTAKVRLDGREFYIDMTGKCVNNCP